MPDSPPAFDPSDSAVLALRVSEELNRRILEAVPGGVVHVDPHGRVVHANQAACDILGLRFDELTRRYVQDFETQTLREDGSPCPAEDYPVSRALVTGKSQPPMTIGVRRCDGTTSWAIFRAVPLHDTETGECNGAVVTFVDITERLRAEGALRASEERWRTLGQNIPDFAVIIDRDGTITSINRCGTGFRLEEVLGHTVYEFVPPSQAPAIRDQIERVFTTGEPGVFEIRSLGDDRRETWFEDRIAPIRRDGKVVAALLIARDISQSLQMKRQLARSERLASVGLLAAGIAHEINNPLAYVMANLDYVLSRVAHDDPDVEAALVEAREGAERVRGIVRELKTFARDDEDKDDLIDIREVLDSALSIARNEIRHRARLVLDIADVVPLVNANAARLGQVLLNLLMNAAQAIVDGHAADNEVRLVVRALEDGSAVAVSITDTGVGVAEEEHARIFDPFYTTKPVGVGTGLGLSICHNIVVGMGGRIEVSSRIGHGSTFTVVLPAATERDDDRPPAGRRREPNPRAPRYEVLVIDDDPPVARAVERLLWHDHGVTTATRAEEALHLLETRHFDAVLCDLMMPDVSGAEVYRRTAARDPQLAHRFVFITGGPFTLDARNLVDATENRVLTKPFGAEELLAVLRDVVEDGSNVDA